MAKKNKMLFCDYYDEWVEVYKVGFVSEITLRKYYTTAKHLRRMCPNLKMSELDRRAYQKLLNEFAKTHEKQTTADFHTQMKACIRDALYEKDLETDPTYRAVVKGKEPKKKQQKFLQREELIKLIRVLDLTKGINKDWFILLLAKTGMRFAECLAVTPADFDWETNQLTINKTWGYRGAKGEGFEKTKTTSSVRKITFDWQIAAQLGPLVKDLPPDEPIFVEKEENGRYKKQHNATYVDHLAKKCAEAGVPRINIHALRHTHGSILLASDVSIYAISQRLGHANVGITQEVYLHVLDDLKQKDEQQTVTALMQII